jgi:hypothetical protein
VRQRQFDPARRARLRNPVNILLFGIVVAFSLWETLSTWGPQWFHRWVTLSEFIHAFEDFMPLYTGEIIVTLLVGVLWLHLVRIAFV